MDVANTAAPSPQAEAIASAASSMAKVSKRLDVIKAALIYGEETKAAEAALADLGALLGLTASRPDNDEKPKTGPDVLWRSVSDKSGIALEAKTDKKPDSMYQKKDDIGQFHDHLGYLKKKYSKESFITAIVGREIPVSQESHPPADLRVIPIEGLQELAERVSKMYEYIAASTDTDPLPVKAQRWLGYLGLGWPACVNALPYSLATDLQRQTFTGEVVS